MDVYGLTGGIGSGKSAAAAIFEDQGIPVVSADELSRVVVTPGSEGLAAVVAAFGEGVLDAGGELDRRKLGALVFKDPAQRQRLESILHPRIRDRFQDVLTMLRATGHSLVIYEVPLLFETGLDKQVKAVILVSAPESVRIARVVARDRLTEPEVRARLAAQIDEATRRARAHYILENDGDLDSLRRQIDELLPRLRGPAPTTRPTPAPPPAPPALRPAAQPPTPGAQPRAITAPQTAGGRPAALLPTLPPTPAPATTPPRVPPPPKTRPK